MVDRLVKALPDRVREHTIPITVGSVIAVGSMGAAGVWKMATVSDRFLRDLDARMAAIERRADILERRSAYRWTVQMMRRYSTELQAGNDMLYAPDVDQIRREYQFLIDEQGNQ